MNNLVLNKILNKCNFHYLHKLQKGYLGSAEKK